MKSENLNISAPSTTAISEMGDPVVRPRCLATLPNNIEELLHLFQHQEDNASIALLSKDSACQDTPCEVS